MLLRSPLALPCGTSLPNRIVKAAMSERLAPPGGQPPASLGVLYRRWSEGGAGLLITGNVMIDPHALGEPGNVVLEESSDLEPFRAWATAAREGGARVWMQLNHPGRQSPRSLSSRPVAPSAVPMQGMYGAFAPPRALEAAEIEGLVQRFAVAAERAVEAGFDGVQVHAAHGYLINQFLSPHTNRRDDAWGGDAERRRRFLLAVVDAVRTRVGPSVAISVKLNSADFQRGGFEGDESLVVAQALEAKGLDLLEISGGTYERPAMFAEGQADSTRQREAFFLEFAEQVRAATGLPLLLTGGFRTAAAMEAALASGAIDAVGLARPLVVEPDLPIRLLNGSAAGAQPIHLRTGIRSLDGVITGAWYERQIERLARSLPPETDMSRLGSLLWYLRGLLFSGPFRRVRGAA